MKHQSWAVAALMCALIAARAEADTLKEALVDAYLKNPELTAGRAQLRSVDELVPQALSGFLPDVFLEGAYDGVLGRGRNSGSNDSTDLDRNTWTAQVVINQNLYSGGLTSASVSRAENLVRQQRAALLSLEQDILLETVQAYAFVWRDRDVLDLALNNERRLRRQLQATKDRFEVGEVSRTDVAQAEARLALASSDIEQARANLAASDAQFRRVVGRPPGELERPTKIEDLPPSFDAAAATALDNPLITNANFALLSAQDDVDVAFADMMPSVDLSARFRRVEEPSNQFDRTEDASLGVVVSIPLYQGGADRSRVRERRQIVNQRRGELEDTHRRVLESVATNWDQLAAATAAIQSFRAQARANDIALQGVQEEALVGARTVLDVLDAEQELFNSQIDLVRAVSAEVIASYQLKAAVGELTVADLGLPLEPYDPEIYYGQVRERLFGIDIPEPRATDTN